MMTNALSARTLSAVAVSADDGLRVAVEGSTPALLTPAEACRLARELMDAAARLLDAEDGSPTAAAVAACGALLEIVAGDAG